MVINVEKNILPITKDSTILTQYKLVIITLVTYPWMYSFFVKELGVWLMAI